MAKNSYEIFKTLIEYQEIKDIDDIIKTKFLKLSNFFPIHTLKSLILLFIKSENFGTFICQLLDRMDSFNSYIFTICYIKQLFFVSYGHHHLTQAIDQSFFFKTFALKAVTKDFKIFLLYLIPFFSIKSRQSSSDIFTIQLSLYLALEVPTYISCSP